MDGEIVQELVKNVQQESRRDPSEQTCIASRADAQET